VLTVDTAGYQDYFKMITDEKEEEKGRSRSRRKNW
jgi:hypothetical protein